MVVSVDAGCEEAVESGGTRGVWTEPPHDVPRLYREAR